MAKKQKAVPASVGIAASHYGVRTGIGAVTEQFVHALQKKNIAVGCINAPAVAGYEDPPRIADGACLVSFEHPVLWKYLSRPIGVVSAALASFDGSYLVPFGDASQILCPSVWSRDAVRARSKARVSTWRFGIDTDVFTPVERERGPALRFLHFSANAGDFRKGADIAVNAFSEAFGDREDVDMVVHSTAATALEQSGRARFTVGAMTPAQLADYYRSFDAVIYSSRAEAFPSVALEAAACGVPVIHSGATAMADIADIGMIVGSHSVRSIDDTGEWFEPFASSIAERMREIDEDYVAVRKRAAADAKNVHARFNWDAAIDAFFRHL